MLRSCLRDSVQKFGAFVAQNLPPSFLPILLTMSWSRRTSPVTASISLGASRCT